MAEFEELRLTVTLIDNASQGLAVLRQNLRALGSSENREALSRMQKEVEGLTTKMGKVREQTTLTTQALTSMGRAVSTAITGLATAFISNFALDSLKKFTDEVNRLDATARQFGVGGANLKSLVDQMKVMGIDAGAAATLVTGFTSAIADLSREGSQLQQNLLKGAPGNVGEMQAFIKRITGFASKGEMRNALSEALRAAESVYQEELKRTQRETGQANTVMAAELRNRFLQSLGIDATTAAQIKGQFKDLTDAEKEVYAARAKIASDFQREWNLGTQKMDDFTRGLQTGLLEPIRKINAAIGEMGDKWGEALGENVGKSIEKLTKELLFLYKLISDPKAAISGAFKDQASQAHPTLQRWLGVETTPENRAYWEKQKQEGNTTMWDPWTFGTPGPGAPPRFPERPPGFQPDPRTLPGTTSPNIHRMSFGGGGPIIVPGGADGYSSSGGGPTRVIRTGVYEALVDFSNYMQAGGSGYGGEGAGFRRASLTTGGGGGGGGYSSSGWQLEGGGGTGGGAVGGGGGGGNIPGLGGGGGAGGGAPATLPGGAPILPSGAFGGGAPAGGGGGQGFLAGKRAGFKKELDENPETRQLLGAIISAENPGAGPAVAESLMNRTELVNQDRAKRGLAPLTLKDMITGHPSIGGGKSFYGPMRSGAINKHMARMRSDPAYAAQMNQRIDQALGGSNTIRGHTDQGSAGDPNYERGGVGVNINRERFNDWGFRGARAWREQREREVAAAGQGGGAAASTGNVTNARTAQSNANIDSSLFSNEPTKTAAAPTQGGGDREAPAAVLAKAREIAALGPRAVSEYMKAQGYPKHDQWCGDFAATAVKAAGGTPPRDWQVASNWRNVGPEVSAADAQPGDIAVARPGWSRRGSGRTGDIGSHVTVFGGNQKGGKFTGVGGNQGAFERQFNVRQYQFYRPQLGAAQTAARSPINTLAVRPGGSEVDASLLDPNRSSTDRTALDRAMGNEITSRVEGTGKLSVDVRAPAGTKVAAGGSGLFSRVEINRATQMEPAQSGPPM